MNKKRSKIKWVYVDHFKCGCIEERKIKKDLTGYCPIHGEEKQEPTRKSFNKLWDRV